MIEFKKIENSYKGSPETLILRTFDDMCLDELLNVFKRFCLALGYSPDLIERVVFLKENHYLVNADFDENFDEEKSDTTAFKEMIESIMKDFAQKKAKKTYTDDKFSEIRSLLDEL